MTACRYCGKEDTPVRQVPAPVPVSDCYCDSQECIGKCIAEHMECVKEPKLIKAQDLSKLTLVLIGDVVPILHDPQHWLITTGGVMPDGEQVLTWLVVPEGLAKTLMAFKELVRKA